MNSESQCPGRCGHRPGRPAERVWSAPPGSSDIRDRKGRREDGDIGECSASRGHARSDASGLAQGRSVRRSWLRNQWEERQDEDRGVDTVRVVERGEGGTAVVGALGGEDHRAVVGELPGWSTPDGDGTGGVGDDGIGVEGGPEDVDRTHLSLGWPSTTIRAPDAAAANDCAAGPSISASMISRSGKRRWTAAAAAPVIDCLSRAGAGSAPGRRVRQTRVRRRDRSVAGRRSRRSDWGRSRSQRPPSAADRPGGGRAGDRRAFRSAVRTDPGRQGTSIRRRRGRGWSAHRGHPHRRQWLGSAFWAQIASTKVPTACSGR